MVKSYNLKTKRMKKQRYSEDYYRDNFPREVDYNHKNANEISKNGDGNSTVYCMLAKKGGGRDGFFSRRVKYRSYAETLRKNPACLFLEFNGEIWVDELHKNSKQIKMKF
jgi:hypothetical protein